MVWPFSRDLLALSLKHMKTASCDFAGSMGLYFLDDFLYLLTKKLQKLQE